MMHHVIDDLSPAELAKVRKVKGRSSHATDPASTHTNGEEKLLAEFGEYYGWNGVRDALQGAMTADTFLGLLYAGRSRKAMNRAYLVSDIHTAVATAFPASKKSEAHAHSTALKKYLKQIEAEI